MLNPRVVSNKRLHLSKFKPCSQILVQDECTNALAYIIATVKGFVDGEKAMNALIRNGCF